MKKGKKWMMEQYQLVNCLIKPIVHMSTKLTYTLQTRHYKECINLCNQFKVTYFQVGWCTCRGVQQITYNHFRRVESKGMTPIMFNILVVLDIGLEALP